MIILVDKQFERDVKKINNPDLNKRIAKLMTSIGETDTLLGISNLAKLTGFDIYYRVRIGDYRVGIELLDDGSIVLVRCLHRKDIYKKFP